MCWNLDANDARASHDARKSALAALAAHTDSREALESAELIIGELLGNAARHADGHVCLELGADDGHAQISVHDTSPSFALDFHRQPDAYSESGRGLYIISELARTIAVVPLTGMGKRVTVTLDLPVATGDAFAPTCMRRWLRHEEGVCMRPRIARYHPLGASWSDG